MGMGREKSSGGSEQVSKVWAEQSPYLTGLYQAGADQLGAFQPNQQIAQGAMGAWGQGLNAGSGPNPYLADMTQQFRDQLGYANQQSGGQAGLTGGFGGGRQGVAEHLNAQAFQSNVGNFLGGQYQADQNRFSNERQNALAMTNQVLGVQPWQQQQSALQQQGQLLGGPTVLGEGSSSSQSSGFNVGLK